MKNRLLMLAATVITLGILAHYFAKPAMAAIAAAMVKNIDERGRNPYQTRVYCYQPSTNSCIVQGPAVPANKRLVVEHLNVALNVPSENPYFELSVYGNNDSSGNGMVFFPDVHLSASDPQSHTSIYISNQPVLTYFEAGEMPTFAISVLGSSTGNYISASYAMSGYLVNLNQ